MPDGAEADVKQGDARDLPFPDGEFDRIVAAEVLEHIPDDDAAIAELVRVLRPGGTIAVTVPRWLPEKVCWALSDAYHEVEGGHVRIYTGDELVGKLERAGLTFAGQDHVHGLHSPYWWIKCAVGVDNAENPLVKAFHRVLVWDIEKRPLPTRLAEKVLDPLIGKSMVLYLEKPDGDEPGHRAARPPGGARSPRGRTRWPGRPRRWSRCSSPTGASPGRSASTSTSGTTSRGPWRCSSVGRWRPPRRRTSGACATQREDGSWPMKIVVDRVEDASGDTNMSAYLAVGVWHHWLVRRDETFVRRFWPVVRRALDFVVGMQLPFGGIAWSQEGGPGGRVNEEALLAGSSSIYHALKAGIALAELVDEPQPGWELAAGRLRHALEEHRDLFLDKSTFSMDWYYPILNGRVRGQQALDLLASRWDDFVVDGLGCRCVDSNNWMTGAETCELVMALDNIGDRDRAMKVFADMLHTRHESGLYWTGWVFPEDAPLADRSRPRTPRPR